jgi:hypothetical protein
LVRTGDENSLRFTYIFGENKRFLLLDPTIVNIVGDLFMKVIIILIVLLLAFSSATAADGRASKTTSSASATSDTAKTTDDT